MGYLATQPVRSLYIHVPFCARKCAYCAFYSEASHGELINRYVTALIGELELVAPDLKPRTVFFGGGTPSLLNLAQWKRILCAMEQLDLLGADEWTVECNPATVSLDKAHLLRDYGVNRISMGVQSLDDGLLEKLGRIHSGQMVGKSFDILRKAGFTNVNLDLMFAIPGQSLCIWRETLKEVLAMGSEHLSAYEVIYEEDTPLYRQLEAGEFAMNEDLACDMYEMLLERARSAGFHQYEIANFARQVRQTNSLAIADDNSSRELPSHSCRHNVNYWKGGEFLGLGPSATSYVAGVRSKNCSNTIEYCAAIEQGHRPIESTEQLSPIGRAGETAAFGLRMTSGWRFKDFERTTGYDLRDQWADDMTELQKLGWGRIVPERFQLTSEGLRFADAAAQMFLRSV